MSIRSIEDIEFSGPPAFGDEHSARKYEEKVEAARSEQQTRWAIAPGCSVSTPNGRRTDGMEIQPADLGGRKDVLRALVQRRVVIELSEAELMKQTDHPDATHVVNPHGKAISTTGGRGILVPGQPCGPSDFAKAPRAAYQRVGRLGVVEEVAAFPGVDGAEKLAELVQAGLIIEKPKSGKRRASR